MRASSVVFVSLLLVLPFARADGHVDDAQGNPAGPFDAPMGVVGCDDLAADVRSLDVNATDDTLTIAMRVWDGAARPACDGVPLPRSQLDHSMLVQAGDIRLRWIRFDTSDVTPLAGARQHAACGCFMFEVLVPRPEGGWTLQPVDSGCLPVIEAGDWTSFTVPIHGNVTTPNGTFAYDFRGLTDLWTLGYTHSFVADQLFCQDWVTGSSST